MQISSLKEIVENGNYILKFENGKDDAVVTCTGKRTDENGVVTGVDMDDSGTTVSLNDNGKGDGTFQGIGCPGMCTVTVFEEEVELNPLKGGNAFVDSIKPPTAQLASLPPGATSAAQAAFLTQQNNAQALNALNKVVSGGWRPSLLKSKSRKSKSKSKSRKRVRWAGTVPIYTPTVSYPEAGTGDNTIAAINKQLTSTMMQSQANAQFDKNAVIKGGTKRHRRKHKRSRRCSKRCRRHNRRR